MKTLIKEAKQDVELDDSPDLAREYEQGNGNKEMPAEFYNMRYKYGYRWDVYYNLSKKVLEILKANNELNKKTIDIGCGVGWFSDMCYFNISRDITGIDFSSKAINMFGKRLYPAVNFEVADIYEYDYTGYEVGIMTEVLEHIQKDIDLMKRFPQGMAVIATVPFEDRRRDVSHVREYSLNTVYDRYSRVLNLKVVENFEDFIILYGIRK